MRAEPHFWSRTMTNGYHPPKPTATSTKKKELLAKAKKKRRRDTKGKA